MPGMAADRRIVTRWPNGERAKIVATTGNAMQGNRNEFLATGRDDSGTKAIRDDALVTALLRSDARPRTVA